MKKRKINKNILAVFVVAVSVLLFALAFFVAPEWNEKKLIYNYDGELSAVAPGATEPICETNFVERGGICVTGYGKDVIIKPCRGCDKCNLNTKKCIEGSDTGTVAKRCDDNCFNNQQIPIPSQTAKCVSLVTNPYKIGCWMSCKNAKGCGICQDCKINGNTDTNPYTNKCVWIKNANDTSSHDIPPSTNGNPGCNGKYKNGNLNQGTLTEVPPYQCDSTGTCKGSPRGNFGDSCTIGLNPDFGGDSCGQCLQCLNQGAGYKCFSIGSGTQKGQCDGMRTCKNGKCVLK